MGTWQQFAVALCGALEVETSPDNVDAFLTWFAGEQPPTEPNAAFNPLNIQAGGFPHVSTTSGGQYNFASWEDGVAQTAAFIRQGYYTGIVHALHVGTDAAAVLEAVQASPWAEGHYGYALVSELGTVRADRDRYAAGIIRGDGGPPDSGPGSDTQWEVGEMTPDELKEVLGQWMQEQTHAVLHQLVGDHGPDTENVLGQWMQQQEAKLEKFIADHSASSASSTTS